MNSFASSSAGYSSTDPMRPFLYKYVVHETFMDAGALFTLENLLQGFVPCIFFVAVCVTLLLVIREEDGVKM